MSLIAALHNLQHEHGHLSEPVLRRLSEQRRVPLHAIQAVVSFYPHFRTTPPPRAEVAVCRDMACWLAGARALRAKLEATLPSDGVEVRAVSCLGRCERAPAVSVNEVPVDGDDVIAISEAAADPGKLASAVAPPPPKRRFQIDPYPDRSQHYGLIRRVRAGNGPDLIALLKEANLRGMGGAAFPTGVKWKMVADQPGSDKVVICNADESEPGTFKDRVILSELPHLVLEGMALAAHVVGARTGTVFLRHEYESARRLVAAEIDVAREVGILGADFDVEIFTSPGGYILGEETALLECMEDKRGEPRNKPPFPGEVGLHGKPTLINNVETFAAATAIALRGADWWQQAGRRGCPGTKFIAVSGHVARPDVLEIPMGTTVRELIDLAGGVSEGRALKAFAPGGASSRFLPARLADTPIDVDHLAGAGSMLGSGALFVVAEGTDMVALATNVVRFFRNESCGKCVPCRVGSEKAVGMLERLLEHGGDRSQLELLVELNDTMAATSICGLGQVALIPILSVIEHFPQDVAKYVK